MLRHIGDKSYHGMACTVIGININLAINNILKCIQMITYHCVFNRC